MASIYLNEHVQYSLPKIEELVLRISKYYLFLMVGGILYSTLQFGVMKESSGYF